MSIVNKVVDYVYGELSNIKEGELFVSLKRVKPLDQLDILHNLQKLGFKTKSYDLATDTWQVIKDKVSNHEEAVKQGYNESLDRYNTALEKYKLLRAEPNMTPSKFIAILKPKQFDGAMAGDLVAKAKKLVDTALNHQRNSPSTKETSILENETEFTVEDVVKKIEKRMNKKALNETTTFNVKGNLAFRMKVAEAVYRKGFLVGVDIGRNKLTLTRMIDSVETDSAFDRFCESAGLDTSVLDKTGHVASVADAESELDAVRLAEGIPLGEMTATSQPDMTKLMSLIHESIMKEDSALEVSDITQSKVKRLKELGYTVTGNPPSSYIISGW